MKTKEEIKAWLLENAVDYDVIGLCNAGSGTVIDLSNIDFGDTYIALNGIEAKAISNDCQIADVISNDYQKAETICNDNQTADKISNDNQKAHQITARGQKILPRKLTLKQIEERLGYKIEVID